MPDNEDRITRAYDALDASYHDDITANLIDLLADLQHMASREGIDFANCLRIATDNYDYERGK